LRYRNQYQGWECARLGITALVAIAFQVAAAIRRRLIGVVSFARLSGIALGSIA